VPAILASIDAVAAGTRAAARLRRDVLIDALRQRLPDWTYEVPDGGLSLWVRLPGADATAFSRLAAAHGVIVRPGPLASPDGGFRDHIRLAFGTSPEQIVEGVDRLAAAWAAYGPRAARTALGASGIGERLTEPGPCRTVYRS
jgi:DNA-binding transcriptional MocR family regulator